MHAHFDVGGWGFYTASLCAMSTRSVLLIIWAAVCLWLLYFSLSAASPVDVKDIHVGLLLWMLVLSFPLGLTAFFGTDLITTFYGGYFNVAWNHHPLFLVFVWVCYFSLGLIQWLVLLPWVIQRLKAAENASA